MIPSFDEMANLRKGILDKVEHCLSKNNYSYEVIVSDDGSRDGGVQFVQQFVNSNSNFKLIKNSHLGKAGAVTMGMLKAVGKYKLFMDMDQATPIEEVDKLLPYFEKGYDIVIGSRSSVRKGAPWSRVLMAKGMIFFRRFIVGVKGISDTQCGFKMFRQEVSDILFSKINHLHKGFHEVSGSSVSAGFDVELLYLAQKMGYKIKEVPVNWLYVETRRVNPIKDSIGGLLDLLRIKINDIKGTYK